MITQIIPHFDLWTRSLWSHLCCRNVLPGFVDGPLPHTLCCEFLEWPSNRIHNRMDRLINGHPWGPTGEQHVDSYQCAVQIMPYGLVPVPYVYIIFIYIHTFIHYTCMHISCVSLKENYWSSSDVALPALACQASRWWLPLPSGRVRWGQSPLYWFCSLVAWDHPQQTWHLRHEIAMSLGCQAVVADLDAGWWDGWI